MSIGDASGTRLSYIAEVTRGTTPSTPVFQNLRFTDEDLKIDTETVISNEIRADRNVPDLIRVGSGASGGFGFELSYGTYDDFLSSLLLADWATNVLKNGIAQTKFVTMEKTFELGTTDSYHRYLGMGAADMSLNIAQGQIVTGRFGMMGYGGAVATAILGSATYTAVNTKLPMNATSDFASLTTTGLATTPQIDNVSLNITNGSRAQRKCGSMDAIGVGFGRVEVSGSLEAYFEDNNMYAAYLAGTSFLLSFTLGSVTAEKYTIAMAKVKIKSSQVLAGGNGQDVKIRAEFQSVYDATDTSSFKVTRAVA